MALPRTVVSQGVIDELARFEALVRTLTPEQWAAASVCAGWTVGDVARHVIGSMSDVVAGRLDGLGTPEVTQREVDERAGRTATELADECSAAAQGAAAMLPLFDDAAWATPGPGGFDGTLGDGVEALWYDTWQHGNDIRASIGADPVFGPGIAAARSHVQWELGKLGWDGTAPADDDALYPFVLVATGRAEPTSLGAGAPPNVYA